MTIQMPLTRASRRPLPIFVGRGNNFQRGAALMAALMFLLIMTMLGLAAVRATTQQTRMAASIQFHTSAFHGAEAAIHSVMTPINTAITANRDAIPALLGAASRNLQPDCTANPLPTLPAIPVNAPITAASTLIQASNPKTLEDGSVVPQCGVCTGAMVVGSSGGSTGLVNYCFDVAGTSQYGGSGAGSLHTQRISYVGPP